MCAWKAFSPHLQFVVHYGWVTAKLGKLFLAAVSPRARESSKQQSLDKNYSIPGSCAPQRSIIGTTVVLLSLFSVSLVVIACVWNRDSRGRKHAHYPGKTMHGLAIPPDQRQLPDPWFLWMALYCLLHSNTCPGLYSHCIQPTLASVIV